MRDHPSQSLRSFGPVVFRHTGDAGRSILWLLFALPMIALGGLMLLGVFGMAFTPLQQNIITVAVALALMALIGGLLTFSGVVLLIGSVRAARRLRRPIALVRRSD